MEGEYRDGDGKGDKDWRIWDGVSKRERIAINECTVRTINRISNGSSETSLS
jgi:hypothetical protein